MKRMGTPRRAILPIALLLVASRPPTASATVDAVTRLERVIPRIMRAHRAPGLAALVVRDGRVVWTRGFGWADVTNRVPVDPTTMFMLASVSKTVTTVAALRLVEAGALALDAPIDPHLPFVVRNPHFPDLTITLRMLLTHTSSIADGPYVHDGYGPGDSTIPLATSLERYFTPGGVTYDRRNFHDAAPASVYDYSNAGIALVGLLVERLAGRSFERFCADQIFSPLGMTDTAWRLRELDVARVALPYTFDRQYGRYRTYGHYGYPDIPNGALRTSAPELAKLLLMVIGDGTYNGVRVLQPTTIAELRRPQVPALAREQALGWYWKRIAGRDLLGHDGGDDGVSTAMFYEPATGVGAIVLTNGEGRAVDLVLRRVLRYASDL
jgi:CubicO group peptidase (beta-lactamase class C family)